MPSGAHIDLNHKSINRSVREKGFTKVKQEHIISTKAKKRRDIEKYEDNANLSASESKHLNAKLASQAAMAVIFAKPNEKPIHARTKTIKHIRKPPTSAESKSINVNESARLKVDNIYRKQTMSPDIVYKEKRKPNSAVNKKPSPRLQDFAAKASLYSNSKDLKHTEVSVALLPNKPINSKKTDDAAYEKFAATQSSPLIHNKKAAPVMSKLAANKALVEYNNYELQQTRRNNDILRQKRKEEAEQQKIQDIEAAADPTIHNGDVYTTDPKLQKELKKATTINKATNELVAGIMNLHEFGSQHQEFDKLINFNSFDSEEESIISEESAVLKKAESDNKNDIKPSNSTTSFKTSQKARIPPPPMSPTFLNQQFDSVSPRSVPELITSTLEYSPVNLERPNSNKVQFTPDLLNNNNMKDKRSSSVSGNSTLDEKHTKTRSTRSKSISTLFHNMITSSNNSSPLTSPSQENNHLKKVLSFSPNSPTESLSNSETNSNNNTATNLFKRTMRSFSLSKKPSDSSKHTDANDEIQEISPNEQKELKEKDKKNVPRVEYSVLHNNLLPSYYKNEDGAINTAVDGSKGSIQFRTTLRDNMKTSDNGHPDSKHKGLMSKLKFGHSRDKNTSLSKILNSVSNLASSSSNVNRKSFSDTKRGHDLSSRFSDSDFSDSDIDNYNSNVGADIASLNHSVNSNKTNRKSTDSKRLSFSSFHSDMHDYDEDLMKYNKAKKDEQKIKHNISGGGRKSDIFIKIPAKLAYNSVKKRADNWEFRKNHTLKNVLKHEDSTASINVNNGNEARTETVTSDIADSVISAAANPQSTVIPTNNKVLDDLSVVKSPEITLPKATLNESSYIIGVHTKPKHKKRFDENKPWKSHVDVGYITNEEKKRYEAIWVSNKNRYLDMLPWYDSYKKKISAVISGDTLSDVGTSTNNEEDETEDIDDFEEDLMVNFVVYEIYNRSNLPPKVLKKIYDLVDKRNDGTLNKQSFIVGMWLIDQCLYGKKLPDEIPDLVWNSVDKMIIGVDISHKSLLKNKKKIARQEIKELKRHERVVKENNKKEQQQILQPSI